MESLNFENMKLSIARPGTKAVAATRPEVATTPTVNKFTINPLASKLMGLEHGDHVTIIVNDQAESMDELLFITHGLSEANQSKLAAVNKSAGVGRVLNFNYSGVWSKILQFEVGAVELSPKALVERGLAVERETKEGNTSYTATKKVSFEIGDEFEYNMGTDEDPNVVTLWPLINPKAEDYTPRDNDAE